jgi:hypothetical protein
LRKSQDEAGVQKLGRAAHASAEKSDTEKAEAGSLTQIYPVVLAFMPPIKGKAQQQNARKRRFLRGFLPPEDPIVSGESFKYFFEQIRGSSG